MDTSEKPDASLFSMKNIVADDLYAESVGTLYIESSAEPRRRAAKFLGRALRVSRRIVYVVVASLILIVGWTGLEDVLDEQIDFQIFAKSGTSERDILFMVVGFAILVVGDIIDNRRVHAARRPGTSVRRNTRGRSRWKIPSRMQLKNTFVETAVEAADEIGSIVMWTGAWGFIEVMFHAATRGAWGGKLGIALLAFVIYFVMYALVESGHSSENSENVMYEELDIN